MFDYVGGDGISFVLIFVGVDIVEVVEDFEGGVIFNVVLLVEFCFFCVVDFGEFDVFFF